SSHVANDKVLDRTIFETLSPEQQREHYAEYGFVLLPNVVSPEQMANIAEEAGGSPRYDFIERWPGPALEATITNPKLLEALRRCYGEDIRFFKAVYEEWRDHSEENRQRGRQRLHRDYTPTPENGDYRNSCASWGNVGYYLIDLEVDEGPLWVVPRSHKLAWTSQDSNFEQYASDARMVLAKAGDAVMFHNLTIHAGGIMRSGKPRPSVFPSYRPAWAAPLGTVHEWPEVIVDQASPALRRLLAGQNDGVRVDAYGIVEDHKKGDL
ncbi:MAG: phytanoyl-CoA dioxygenase family protein, partial [Gammaproteobacteria bacterium]|nr:phytanoyl-CoA dioxygenase family protein [Gammaproteobacteria bacterium]